MKQLILEHLRYLVGFDTQNPPRAISATDPVFDYIRSCLNKPFEFELTDHGRGRVSLLAIKGQPRVLLNVHLDTVPFGDNWNYPPNELTIVNDRAYGRGVCDIKGAAAAMLAAANSGDEHAAILFTTDEEGTENCCVQEFCDANGDRFEMAIVAEPTGCQAVLEHRGYLSVTGLVNGVAGHTSQNDCLSGSANRRAIEWCAEAIEFFEKDQVENNRSMCFNIGRLDGGTKNNVVAERAMIGWSVRPMGVSNDEIFKRATRGEKSGPIDWSISFSAPALQLDPRHTTRNEEFITQLQLTPGDPVDFWTEAALFSQAGIPAIVLGPGNIAQAHTSDEWVAVDQLVNAAEIYQRIQKHK